MYLNLYLYHLPVISYTAAFTLGDKGLSIRFCCSPSNTVNMVTGGKRTVITSSLCSCSFFVQSQANTDPGPVYSVVCRKVQDLALLSGRSTGIHVLLKEIRNPLAGETVPIYDIYVFFVCLEFSFKPFLGQKTAIIHFPLQEAAYILQHGKL